MAQRDIVESDMGIARCDMDMGLGAGRAALGHQMGVSRAM